MNDKKVVFYSWQSDTDKKTNNYFIKSALEKALKRLNKETESEVSLDSDTRGVSGSGNIVDTIFRKIQSSNIFLCDVTSVGIVYNSPNSPQKKVSNSNVMIELGYAVKTLGWERIICISNLHYGTPQELPFDIRSNRISTFYCSPDADNEQKKKSQQSLSNLIYSAVKLTLDDYDNILLRVKKDDFIEYDREIFRKIREIFPEEIVNDLTKQILSKGNINNFQYKEIEELAEFRNSLENWFIDEDLRIEFDFFVKTLIELYKAVKTWSSRIEEHNKNCNEARQRFGAWRYIDHKGFSEEKERESIKIRNKTKSMKDSYQKFRFLIKIRLLI